MIRNLSIIWGLILNINASAQYLKTDFPLSYVIAYANRPPIIDGKMEDEVWKDAAWTSDFVDIEGGNHPIPYFKTAAKMLWDDNYLYIAAKIEESDIWAYLKERDDIVYNDNDFEVFIDPSNSANEYFEIEVNAINNIFDLFLSRPYRAGYQPLFSWGSNKLKTAVHIEGTLNDSSDKDKYWTVEMAIPFSELTLGTRCKIPNDGDIWRLNMSRVEWDTEVIGGKYVRKSDVNGERLPEHNWVWTPQGKINMHMPENWGYVKFTKNISGAKLPMFVLPYREKQRVQLWKVYYAEKEYFNVNKRYTSDVTKLQISSTIMIDGVENRMELLSNAHQFIVTISDEKNHPLSLTDEGEYK